MLVILNAGWLCHHSGRAQPASGNPGETCPQGGGCSQCAHCRCSPALQYCKLFPGVACSQPRSFPLRRVPMSVFCAVGTDRLPPPFPTAVVSEHLVADVMMESIRTGADDFLSLPLTFDDMNVRATRTRSGGHESWFSDTRTWHAARRNCSTTCLGGEKPLESSRTGRPGMRERCACRSHSHKSFWGGNQ